MVRTIASAAVLAGTIALCSAAACTSLLDTPSQCSSDRDCVRWDAVCDRSQAICVPRGSLDGSADPRIANGSDASALDPACRLETKPSERIGMGLPTGPDGGAVLAQSLSLGCDKDWLLEGPLVVAAGATLTILPGTTIRAHKASGAAIIVQQGGRIVADGLHDAPIVFTVDDAAPKAGDWRGVFVLGRAPRAGTTTYKDDPLMPFGGTDEEDGSGVLRFVRIEYARDGLVLAALGRKTSIDSIHVRFTGENCFTLHGGRVNAKHLVCQSPADEQFDIAQGYVGRLQFLYGQGTAGFGHDGILVDGTTTSAAIYNATICGKAAAANQLGDGVVVQNGGRLDGNDIVVTGWSAGVDWRGAIGTPTYLRGFVAHGNAANTGYVENASPDAGGTTANDDNGFDETAAFRDGGNSEVDPKIVDCHDVGAPKPWPETAITRGARTPPSDGFFDTTAVYVGAWSGPSDTWMTGAWLRFAPN